MREAYAQQLDAIVDEIIEMSQHVEKAVGLSTEALLNADAHVAESVISEDEELDRLRVQIEEQSFELMALQQPVATDLRMLVSSLRIVADFERMGDLAVHVAKIARMRVPGLAIPDELRPMFERAGEVTQAMVRMTGEVIRDRDLEKVKSLIAADEEIDLIRRRGFEMMLSPEWRYGVEPAVDLALLGRYYERIADHAVSIARRIVFLVTGEGHPA
jgi:phosphate transport system protein